MNADYVILSDGRFTLAPNGDRTFAVTLPTGVPTTGNQRPILAFLVRSAPSIGTMHFRVDVNDRPQINEHLGADERGGFWEVLEGARVGPNTIQFRVLGGFGNVTFSDVVLWYQRP